MADTDTETLPNGIATLTEEEEERLKQRPADIDADVREMERRKRVEALMSSRLFREELERVLEQQAQEGGDAPLLQRIREMVGGRLHSGSLRGPTCVLPINDIRGIEGVGYEKGEKILRCKLAAVYRLVDLFGWTQNGLNGQITARLNTAVEQVLTTPRGLLPHEVTASSLVKVDMQGAIVDQGTTNFPVNVEGFSLHAAVHAARPDLRCVVHVRSASALAVSSLRRGLLPLCHEAAALGDYALHRAPRGILDNEEKDKLVRALGPHAKVLLLSNAGALCCGATLEEAFHHARLLTAAADVQLRLASVPVQELDLIDEDTRRQIYEASIKPPPDAVKWRAGGEEFEALMRMLDNAGFRTGYIYRHPLIKNDVPRPKNDVEVPPAVSSLGYLLEEEELYKQGFWKKGQGKTGERTRWLNSPNVYQKVEVLETGTTDPKKITKWVDANNEEWVQDGSPSHSSTPVKIDTLQFVPKNTNPKEFKKLQQQIKDNRRADKISAGPQSHILEGVTWDEASKLVSEDAANTHTGDHVVLMGAASKGIIQRGYQHNATMYSAPYARNPFDHVTDNEIEAYRRAVERKGRGDYDTDLSESEAISGAQITSPASAPSETEEESRDEHRVLRIETMQAPVRSQPEVVLSDVDTTDFLNAERAHADRTKETRDPTPCSDDDVFATSAVKTGVHSVITARAHHRVVGRDPNLLSDDEVFLDSTASTVTSSMTSGVTSPQPPATVVIRAQHTAVAQTVKGTKEANTLKEAFSANKRSIHDYTRSPNFDYIVKIYENPNKIMDKTGHPKCKVNLHSRLNHNALEPLASSRSSLLSIPSLEWDGRAKSDYGSRTCSLGRKRENRYGKLYRTSSHSGFINSYIRDPEPMHYHLPRCRSCGATSSSYIWELTKEEKQKRKISQTCFSVENIPQKCGEEIESVKVKETVVPVFKVEKVSEFVESQEFTEDNYLGELGNSFSSENQTVIEKQDPETEDIDVAVTNDKTDNDARLNYENCDIFRAECAQIDPVEDIDSTLDTEGEYHSFTDDFEEAYESPVKDLVEKDIRDYSVPINLYCDDYLRKSETNPKKSPSKVGEAMKTVLEPISEESKSSYGEDSSNLSSNGSKRDSDMQTLSENNLEEVSKAADSEVNLKTDTEQVLKKQIESVNDEARLERDAICMMPVKLHENITHQTDKIAFEADKANSISDGTQIKLSLTSDDHRKSSVEYSVASSTNELVTLDSTAEFEKYEAISELLISLLDKIDYEKNNNDFFLLIDKRHKEVRGKDIFQEIKDHRIIEKSHIFDNIHENEKVIDAQGGNALELTDKNNAELNVGDIMIETRVVATLDNKESLSLEKNCVETFSITELIQDIENCHLNETILTESDSGVTEPFKIAESILYYIFDRAYYVSNKKNKKKTTKNVVTVVDLEDILYTAQKIWLNSVINENIDTDNITDISNDNLVEKDAHESDNSVLIKIEANENVSHQEVEAIFNAFDYLNEDLDRDMNNNSELELHEHNPNSTDEADEIFIESNHGKVYTDSYEYLAPTPEDVIQLLVKDDKNCDDIDKENTMIIGDKDLLIDQGYCDRVLNISQDLIETCNDSDVNCLDSTNKITVDSNFTATDTTLNSDHELDETITEHSDEMNMAFVHDACTSSPTKGRGIFESCTESPIRNPSNSFVGQDLTIPYEVALSGSPFVKRAPVISMSQTENSGGVKYWLSFDDSITDDAYTKSFNDSVSQRVWKKAKRVDDAIPSFYSVEFGNENRTHATYPRPRKFSVLIDSSEIRTDESINEYDVNAQIIEQHIDDKDQGDIDKDQNDFDKYQGNINKYQGNTDKFESGTDKYHSEIDKDLGHVSKYQTHVDISAEIQVFASPSSSNLYSTCETILDADSPQKKLLYEVHKRKRLHNTWPPFEDTIFYRIISKFRMSESFDYSDLDTARIGSL